jgi:hypothetical protein
MLPEVEKKIDKLRTESLAAGGKFDIESIPVRKFYDQAQYLEKTILPAVAKRSGEGSADYEFFAGIYKSLLYAVMIVDRGDLVIRQLQQIRQINRYNQERADLAEKELLKYSTIEDLLLTDGLDKIAAGVKQRVENLLTKKP